MTINIAYHANDPSVGMNLHRNVSRYKMFMSDTGLFVVFSTDTGDMEVFSKADGSWVQTIAASASRYKMLVGAGNNVVIANGITISRVNDTILQEKMFFPTVDRVSTNYNYVIGLNRGTSGLEIIESATVHGLVY